jgi:hypothetical protein
MNADAHERAPQRCSAQVTLYSHGRELLPALIGECAYRVQHFEKLQRDGKGESLRNAEIHFTGGDVRCRPPARPPAAQLSFASPV